MTTNHLKLTAAQATLIDNGDAAPRRLVLELLTASGAELRDRLEFPAFGGDAIGWTVDYLAAYRERLANLDRLARAAEERVARQRVQH